MNPLLLLVAVGLAAASPPSVRLDGGQAAAPRSDLTCGSHTLTEGSYTISSPNNPANYANNYDCTYSVAAGAGVASFYLDCSEFSLESDRSCRWDWLEVGGVRFCGSEGPAVARAGPLSLIFHSDYSVVSTGFRCTLAALSASGTATALSCGAHTLTPGLYSVASPGYPATYGNNFDCAYNITAGAGVSSMTLACCEFDIEASSSGCSFDWLQVGDARFCGRQGPAVSGSEQLAVAFHSDGSVVRRGYLCEVQALGD